MGNRRTALSRLYKGPWSLLSKSLCVGWTLALLVSAANAEVFVVTKESDDDGPCDVDDCALREAVLAANASPGPDTITLASGTYQLSIEGPLDNLALTGDLDILDILELRGENSQSTIIVGDGTDRVFHILSTTIDIFNVTITGGSSFPSGGGLRAEVSDVSIVDSMITGNSTTEDGGGIFFGIGDLVLVNSAITDNSAGSDGLGGGIRSLGITTSPANLSLINSTISGNSAFSGGGIYALFDNNVTLVHSTLANNTASFRGDSFANDFSAPPTFINTLFVGDCAIGSRPPISNGGNIESPGDSCQLNHPEDRHSVPKPGIGPLADNGGPTPTHALLLRSPAIDAAVAAGCPSTDQRGLSRPLDGDLDGVAACDIGAYELSPQLAIPVLSPAGLLGLVVLLASSAFAVLRRRPPTSSAASARCRRSRSLHLPRRQGRRVLPQQA